MAAQPDTTSHVDLRRQRIIGAIALVLVAIAAAISLSMLDRATRSRVERNAQLWILERLDRLVPADARDNDILSDRLIARSPDLLGTSRAVTVYRARKAGQPVAAVLHTIAPDGYFGPIELLVGIGADGRLIGVQVVRHRETPGLGDAFENRNLDWLPKFRGRSLTNPPQQRWAVRSDGGHFDSFTGATITPRAIVKAVRRALEFYRAKQQALFTAANGTEIH
jgi:Na+-translocating ferredoxin:NAD+ oxidoreductase subunit G